MCGGEGCVGRFLNFIGILGRCRARLFAVVRPVEVRVP